MDMAKLPVTFPFELPVAVNATLWPVEEGKHDGAGTKLKLATFTAVPLPWVRFIENAKAGDPSGLFSPAPPKSVDVPRLARASACAEDQHQSR